MKIRKSRTPKIPGNPKRGKQSIMMNFFLILAVIAGLSVHFTREGVWGVIAVVIIAMLSLTAAFYLWLWVVYFRE
jgi:membrane protein YdbS with pleckstrin-like domain